MLLFLKVIAKPSENSNTQINHQDQQQKSPIGGGVWRGSNTREQKPNLRTINYLESLTIRIEILNQINSIQNKNPQNNQSINQSINQSKISKTKQKFWKRWLSCPLLCWTVFSTDNETRATCVSQAIRPNNRNWLTTATTNQTRKKIERGRGPASLTTSTCDHHQTRFLRQRQTLFKSNQVVNINNQINK